MVRRKAVSLGPLQPPHRAASGTCLCIMEVRTMPCGGKNAACQANSGKSVVRVGKGPLIGPRGAATSLTNDRVAWTVLLVMTVIIAFLHVEQHGNKRALTINW